MTALGAAVASDAHPLRPSAVELADGLVHGTNGGGPRARLEGDQPQPRAALEDAVLPALLRPPCLVSFSAGRDSSTILATALNVARREGLEPPVPITLRFPSVPATDESAWQERVTRHLGMRDWEIREIADELDFVGPVAARAIRRHGVLFPPNAFLHIPMAEAARGGSLLTGIGGDQLFTGWRWQALADVMARRRRPVPRDLLRIANALAPAPVRRAWLVRRRPLVPIPWLTPEARRARDRLAVAERLEEPRRWPDWVSWIARTRYLGACCWSLSLLGDDVDVQVAHPFAEPGVVAAVARVGDRNGIGDRTAAMRRLFGGLLPDWLLARRGKARFDEVFWRRHSQELARSWDGEDVDRELVDPGPLGREWLRPVPSIRSAMLLQSVWLARERRRND